MSKKKMYLAGNIMSHGDALARQEEYDRVKELGLDLDIYSPILNKSINDKTSVTEEENNHLAEKIVEADIDRLWNSDTVVICPEQHAIGTLCELGVLFGWQYMADKLFEMKPEDIWQTILKIRNQDIYAHYPDIRTNHLNEKDWRRSFGINQMLYGMIKYIEKNGDIETLEDILKELKDDNR